MAENWIKDYQEKKDEINIDITKASTKESTKESTQKRSMEIVEDSLTGKFSAYQSAHFSDSVSWNVYAVDFSWKMFFLCWSEIYCVQNKKTQHYLT